MNNRIDVLAVGDRSVGYYPVRGIDGADKLPYSLRILLENVLRMAPDDDSAARFAGRVVSAGLAGEQGGEIEYMPARVLLQDFTGVPVFVDLAAMREAARDLGGDPSNQSPNSSGLGRRSFGHCRRCRVPSGA